MADGAPTRCSRVVDKIYWLLAGLLPNPAPVIGLNSQIVEKEFQALYPPKVNKMLTEDNLVTYSRRQTIVFP